jgi:hypothetical protein
MTDFFNQLASTSPIPSTMDLLDMALRKDDMRVWARRLGLSEEALRTARSRRRLSPVVAGCLAEELEEDPQRWIVIATLETERESTCKARMLEYFSKRFSWGRLP